MMTMKQYSFIPFLFCTAVLFVCPCNAFCGSRTAQPVRQYHGMRMTMNGSSFYVRSADVEKDGQGCISADFRFNAAVDPRTVKPASVMVNGNPVPPDTKVIFNKAGTEMLFVFSPDFSRTLDESGISIELPDAASFDSTPLVMTVFDGLVCGCPQMYAKP